MSVFNVEQQLEWMEKADELVQEAQQDLRVVLADPIPQALANAIRTSFLSVPGMYNIVEAIGKSQKIST